jgi:hypothetical protein
MGYLRTVLRYARERLDSPYWRFLLLLSCVLVFAFAFHAKVAVYHNPQHVDGSTSSKLWLNADKMQTPASQADVAVFWLLSLLTLLICLPEIRAWQTFRRAPVSSPLNQLNLRRFLRPPPRQ